jgi:hypothetical protein
MADAKRFLEGRVGKFEESVLRQRHEMKEAWFPWHVYWPIVIAHI